MKQIIILTICFLYSTHVFPQQNTSLSGYVKDALSKEPLIGVTIQIENSNTATQTNHYGFFSISSKKQDFTLVFSMVGYQTKKINSRQINNNIEVLLAEDTQLLDAVEVKANQQPESSKKQMSSLTLSAAQIKQMPLILGEKDPLKALQMLPGVGMGTEGTSGFFVRGGGADQNLLMLDEAIVYNANHLFGFFSTFNADPIKQVELFKGAFPARYGGRLSSVVDVQMKEGNKQKYQGEGGIGLISSRLTIEGPIKKNKSSFLLSGRRTYADLLTKPFFPKNSSIGYYFYDVNAKLNTEINSRNNLFLSFYLGNDKLSTHDIQESAIRTRKNDTNIGWGNVTTVLRWNHVYNAKIFSNLSLIQTKYNFQLNDFSERIANNESSSENLLFRSNIKDYTLKADFDYFHSEKFSAKWGLNYTLHQFTPRIVGLSFLPNSEQNIQNSTTTIQNNEGALYLETSIPFKHNFTLNLGARESFYYYSSLKLNFEPRISFHKQLPHQQSVQGSYARMNQYVNQLSNTGVGLPTDLWVPATDRIPYSQSDQWAFSYTKDNILKGVSLTFETYYKTLKNIVAYKGGASFLDLNNLNDKQKIDWENDLTSGKGWAYGYEWLLQKKAGKFTGLMGYTLSWTIHQFDEINNGKPFYATNDRRHNLELSASYALNKQIRLSANALYMSGNVLTTPTGVYSNSDVGNSYSLYYDKRNNFRTEPYHRVDVGIQFYKKKKWGEQYWDISVYNVYNRKNPFYYSTVRRVEQSNSFSIGLTRNWLLPILPAITYNFKF